MAETENKNAKSSKYSHLQKQKVQYEGKDAWQENVEKFEKGHMRHSMVEVTTFQEKYPEYMGAEIKKEFTQIKNILKDHGIKVAQDERQQILSVSTSNETWDPYSIMNGKTFIQLICRSMPIKLAAKIFEDDKAAEIIKVKGLAADDEVFKKRRRRLLGKDDTTITMVERLLDIHVKVQGGTVAVLGGYKNVITAQKIILGVMTGKQIPYYSLKELQIMMDLKNNPEYKDASWDELLPEFKSTQLNKPKKKKKKIEKKEYNPFPPEREESHLDKQMAEGRYFIGDSHFKKGYKDGQKETSQKKQDAKRARKYTAPEEEDRRQKPEGIEPSPGVDIAKVMKKLKRKAAEEDGEDEPVKKKKKSKVVEEDEEEPLEKKSKKKKNKIE